MAATAMACNVTGSSSLQRVPALSLRASRGAPKPRHAAPMSGRPSVAARVATTEGPIILDGQLCHSLTEERLDVVRSLDDFASTELFKLLKPVDKCWQPQDFLPDPASDDFLDQLAEIRKRTANLPDDYLVVLAGDMITEEALPTYMTMLNTLDGVRDETGASQSGWARWTRQWTAEENRHGDLLNKYMWVTGKVDMRAIEVTIQNLIGSGMNPKTENNPYMGFVYTSFQERATKISHGHTGIEAAKYGDDVLAKICGSIAADEGRHEIAYTRIVDELFARDPDGAMIAFADMMRKQIVMPAHMMNDNTHYDRTGRDLFTDFSAVAERMEVYTAFDYADIMEHLIKRWEVADVSGLGGEAAADQEYLMKLPNRIRKLAERAASRKAKAEKHKEVQFSWIYDRPLDL